MSRHSKPIALPDPVQTGRGLADFVRGRSHGQSHFILAGQVAGGLLTAMMRANKVDEATADELETAMVTAAAQRWAEIVRASITQGGHA